MKKKLLLLLLPIILTGCTAEYNLNFEDGVFEEEITIHEDKDVSGSDSFVSITDVDQTDDRIKLDDGEYYLIEHTSDSNSNILKLDYKYDNLSLEKSLVFQNCFYTKTFMDKDDYYYIKLSGDITCEYLGNSTVTFKTDKKVIKSNASEIDEKNGIYKWDTDKIQSDGIEFQVSKSLKLNAKTKSTTLIPWYVSIILFGVVAVVFYIIIKRVKNN